MEKKQYALVLETDTNKIRKNYESEVKTLSLTTLQKEALLSRLQSELFRASELLDKIKRYTSTMAEVKAWDEYCSRKQELKEQYLNERELEIIAYEKIKEDMLKQVLELQEQLNKEKKENKE